MNADGVYPVLLIPKKCTSLESECEATDNVFIDLTVSSRDIEGNDMCIYSGFCNVKLIDSCNVDYQCDSPVEGGSIELIDADNIPLSVGDCSQFPFQLSNQSQVWIDPAKSPYVYNQYDGVDGLEQYSVCQQTQSNRITVEQHNTTFITQNVYNYENCVTFEAGSDFEHKKFRKGQMKEMGHQQMDCNLNLYEEDEFECGVFLSQLPKEIMLEKEVRDRKERKFVGLQSENNALKQLMSSDIQSVSKQQKTILFLGHDSSSGETIQKIAVNDPFFECAVATEERRPIEPIQPNQLPPSHKKYQCDKCKQIFNQITTFRQHIVGNHVKISKYNTNDKSTSVSYMCQECGKKIKTKEKFEAHCMRHGDPDLECDKCHKVFSSKFTLRTHSKLHSKKYQCSFCLKNYSDINSLRAHKTKKHFPFFFCEICDGRFDKYEEFVDHRATHKELNQNSSDTEFVNSINEGTNDMNMITLSPTEELKMESIADIIDDIEEITISEKEFGRHMEDLTAAESEIGENIEELTNSQKEFGDNSSDMELNNDINNNEEEIEEQSSLEEVKEGEVVDVSEKIRKADSVIATVMSNGVFLSHSKKIKRHHKYNKICDVCKKTFNRIGDLKRHLIEHVVGSTLAKTPVSKDGTLKIQCEVCQIATFSKIDRYKAHLREHAKLTLYKCTFCDKSFSDSSNFSKHKKIHGSTYLQCDLCQRKFNSKKMITQHMEYHNSNKPMPCKHCDKVFHFQSMLNKHMKSTHNNKPAAKFRCQFCKIYFKSLKEKWDHEWMVHNVRKMIADCTICYSKFRKYSELKRHCLAAHNKPLDRSMLHTVKDE